MIENPRTAKDWYSQTYYNYSLQEKARDGMAFLMDMDKQILKFKGTEEDLKKSQWFWEL